MIISLSDPAEAQSRIAAGELPYEFRTSDPALCLTGPASGFGAEYLERRRKNGLYAASLEEALVIARARNVTITGVWFVKRQS